MLNLTEMDWELNLAGCKMICYPDRDSESLICRFVKLLE